jgi:hypothetical protein
LQAVQLPKINLLTILPNSHPDQILPNAFYQYRALLQKTFVSNVLTKETKKNTGELPQYYITNNHPVIVDRDVFQRVQEEIARRGCKRKTPSKTTRTAQSKYSVLSVARRNGFVPYLKQSSLSIKWV